MEPCRQVIGVKRLYRVCENGIPITIYNPYNLVTCGSRNCFTEEISGTITFIE